MTIIFPSFSHHFPMDWHHFSPFNGHKLRVKLHHLFPSVKSQFRAAWVPWPCRNGLVTCRSYVVILVTIFEKKIVSDSLICGNKNSIMKTEDIDIHSVYILMCMYVYIYMTLKKSWDASKISSQEWGCCWDFDIPIPRSYWTTPPKRWFCRGLQTQIWDHTTGVLVFCYF